MTDTTQPMPDVDAIRDIVETQVKSLEARLEDLVRDRLEVNKAIREAREQLADLQRTAKALAPRKRKA